MIPIVMSNNKRLQLIGKTISPIITKKPIFFIKGCKVTFTRKLEFTRQAFGIYPKKIHYGKLVKGERKAPTIKSGYMGYIIVDFPGVSAQAEKKLTWFLQQESLGTHQNEGMGKIQWLEKKEINPVKRQPRKKKLVIRKGLGKHPKPLQTAIKALLLHDFVHTEKHDSKIYNEIEIHNGFIREACKNHHNGEKSDNWLIPIIKKYDGLAAFLNRRIPRREERRYDYQNGDIDCKTVAEEITEKQQNIYSLYNYIYYNKTFARFYETIDFANNKLRKHLLLMVNLLINDFKKGKLVLKNNKIMVVSSPVKEEENEKFLSESMVLKRINMSKKGLAKDASLQVRSVEEEIPSAKNREKPLAT
ncbi:MAG: hypothetical protein ACTSP5_01005 [Candidatus Heimdallarchaeota archaeon]